MAKYFALFAALGTVFTAGTLAAPLIVAGFMFSRKSELDHDWMKDRFMNVALFILLVTIVVFWVPPVVRAKHCADLREQFEAWDAPIPTSGFTGTGNATIAEYYGARTEYRGRYHCHEGFFYQD